MSDRCPARALTTRRARRRRIAEHHCRVVGLRLRDDFLRRGREGTHPPTHLPARMQRYRRLRPSVRSSSERRDERRDLVGRRLARACGRQRQVHVARSIGSGCGHDHGPIRASPASSGGGAVAGARHRQRNVERDLGSDRLPRRAGCSVDHRAPSLSTAPTSTCGRGAASGSGTSRAGSAATMVSCCAARPAYRPDWRVRAAGCVSCCRPSELRLGLRPALSGLRPCRPCAALGCRLRVAPSSSPPEATFTLLLSSSSSAPPPPPKNAASRLPEREELPDWCSCRGWRSPHCRSSCAPGRKRAPD